jgi:hypothetical protein
VGRSILLLRLCVSTTDQSRRDDPPQQRVSRQKNMANVYIEAPVGARELLSKIM